MMERLRQEFLSDARISSIPDIHLCASLARWFQGLATWGTVRLRAGWLQNTECESKCGCSHLTFEEYNLT